MSDVLVAHTPCRASLPEPSLKCSPSPHRTLTESLTLTRVNPATQLPSGQRQAVPYALATGPPFLLALAFPALFFSALDFAGCYGVLTLFGLLPVAMAWSERYQVSGCGGSDHS